VPVGRLGFLSWLQPHDASFVGLDTSLPPEGAWRVLPDGVVRDDAPTAEQQRVHARRVARWGGDGEMPAEEREKRRAALAKGPLGEQLWRRGPRKQWKANRAERAGPPPPSFFEERVVEFGPHRTRQQCAEAAAAVQEALAAQAREAGWVLWPADNRWPPCNWGETAIASYEAFKAAMVERHGEVAEQLIM